MKRKLAGYCPCPHCGGQCLVFRELVGREIIEVIQCLQCSREPPIPSFVVDNLQHLELIK